MRARLFYFLLIFFYVSSFFILIFVLIFFLILLFLFPFLLLFFILLFLFHYVSLYYFMSLFYSFHSPPPPAAHRSLFNLHFQTQVEAPGRSPPRPHPLKPIPEAQGDPLGLLHLELGLRGLLGTPKFPPPSGRLTENSPSPLYGLPLQSGFPPPQVLGDLGFFFFFPSFFFFFFFSIGKNGKRVRWEAKPPRNPPKPAAPRDGLGFKGTHEVWRGGPAWVRTPRGAWGGQGQAGTI